MNLPLNTPTGSSPSPDFTAIKARQQLTWSAGDYAAVGTTLQKVGEDLCETIDLRPGSLVLDVAAGNGNASLAAARRFCEVTSTDYVPALLKKGEERARAERLDIRFEVADAEALPFADRSFDVVLSTFGVMFSANHAKAAAELLRVCRPQGVIGLSNWTPEGFIGRVFGIIGRHIPPAPGLKPPSVWGTEIALREWFPDAVAQVTLHPRIFNFRYRSEDHFITWFRDWYGPVQKAYEALGNNAAGLDNDLRALLRSLNTSRDGALIVPSAYVDVVIHRR